MINKVRTWLTVRTDAFGIIAATLVALAFNFALEYLTGIDSGTLGRTATPVHYTETNASQDNSSSEPRDRAEVEDRALFALDSYRFR